MRVGIPTLTVPSLLIGIIRFYRPQRRVMAAQL
jgi:hypothetical protein